MLRSEIFLLFLLAVTACKKTKTRVCEDSAAAENPGMVLPCQYIGKAVFWLNKSTSDSLAKHGFLDLYIDGKLMATADADSQLQSAPECSETVEAGKLLFIKDLRGEKTKSFSYEVKFGSQLLWSGNVTLEGKKCLAEHLH